MFTIENEITFNIGDRVICIDDGLSPYGFSVSIVKGRIYKIVEISDDGHFILEGIEGEWLSKRFERKF